MSNEWKDYQRDLREQFDANTEELNSLPEGWVNAFVPQMKDELFNVLGSHAEDFCVIEAKEKWCSMRVYWNWAERKRCEHEMHDLDELTSDVEKIIAKYTDISFKTCMVCGDDAVGYTRGYILPVCNDCYMQVD